MVQQTAESAELASSAIDVESLIVGISQLIPTHDRWISTRPVVVHLLYTGFIDARMSLDIPAGYLFEHSVPKVFQGFISPTYGCRAAAFFHDAFYRSGLVSKGIADQFYSWFTSIPQIGVNRYHRMAANAVRVFGQTESSHRLTVTSATIMEHKWPFDWEPKALHLTIHIHVEKH